MRLSHGLAALAILATASMAHADLSGTLTAVSDYDFRGVTQTAQDPALQGSIDWAAESGFYVGAWASNIDFGNSLRCRRRSRLVRRIHRRRGRDVGRR